MNTNTAAKAGSTLVMEGKPRTLGSSRAWRVRAYDGRRPRVTFLNPALDWKRDQVYVAAGDDASLAKQFERVEHLIDAVEAGTAGRTVGEVCRLLHIDWDRSSTLQEDTKDGRLSFTRKWICSVVPTVERQGILLAEWGVEAWDTALSRKYLAAVAATDELGPARLEDLRTHLASIRNKAQDLGWMARDNDPLRGVKVPKVRNGTPEQNGRIGYVPQGMRPSTAAVETLLSVASAAANVPGRHIDPLQLRVGCYMGLRLSEQLGVAVEDLEVTRGGGAGGKDGVEVIVGGAWLSPRRSDPFWRPYPKNGKWRPVPPPASLVEQLLDQAGKALGLPPGTDRDALVTAIEDCRTRFAAWYHLGRQRDSVQMPARHYLFVDPRTGVPWEQEKFNQLFRELRSSTLDLAREDDAITPWPLHIPYRNARHHTAMWWRRQLPEATDEDWTLVAKMLGNSPDTCRKHYVVLGEGAYEAARRRLLSL